MLKILITNDDGIHAKGLHILAQALKEIGDIYVVAPSEERSGAGHGLTVHIPLRAWRTTLPGITDNAWAVSGLPADCVKLGIEMLLGFKPDLVVSGINNGPNLGTDIIYSGTVAGAMEGYLNGVNSIAVSVAGKPRKSGNGNFELAARMAVEFGEKLKQDNCMLLNINVPGNNENDVQGLRYASMGWRWYENAYDRRIDPANKEYFWLHGNPMKTQGNGNSDVELCEANYITVTPLQFNMTDEKILSRLNSGDLAL